MVGGCSDDCQDRSTSSTVSIDGVKFTRQKDVFSFFYVLYDLITTNIIDIVKIVILINSLLFYLKT